MGFLLSPAAACCSCCCLLLPAEQKLMHGSAFHARRCAHINSIRASVRDVRACVRACVRLCSCLCSFSLMDEQMVVQESVPLSCPLTMNFLKNPCRGEPCTHLTCFEFEVCMTTCARRRPLLDAARARALSVSLHF